MNLAYEFHRLAKAIYSFEFDTKDQMEAYLKLHPDADKSLHWVKQQTKTNHNTDVKQKTNSVLQNIENLPSISKQPNVKNADDFYAQATKGFTEMIELLNQGRGLDSKIGAKVVSSKEMSEALNSDVPVIVIGNIKSKGRAEEKVKSDYGGDWGLLRDGVRATVSVKKLSEIEKVISELSKMGMKLAQKPKDRYKNPTVAGYRDLLLNIQYPGGHIGELQINCHEMLKAKELGHKLYEETRTIAAKAQQEGRDYMTDEELSIVAEANRKMKALYEDAFKAIQGD